MKCHWTLGTFSPVVRNTPAMPCTHLEKSFHQEEWKERLLQGLLSRPPSAPTPKSRESLGPAKAPLFKQRFSLKNFASPLSHIYIWFCTNECLKRPMRSISTPLPLHAIPLHFQGQAILQKDAPCQPQTYTASGVQPHRRPAKRADLS